MRVGQARVRLAQKARSKYGAIATTVDGIRFHSAKEARRYGELLFRGKAGEIRNLELQPVFPLIVLPPDDDEPLRVPGVVIGSYRADFAYEEWLGLQYSSHAWLRVVEDVKGFKTPLYRWKKKHVEAQYGIEIREI